MDSTTFRIVICVFLMNANLVLVPTVYLRTSSTWFHSSLVLSFIFIYMTVILEGFLSEFPAEDTHVVDETAPLLHLDVQRSPSHNALSTSCTPLPRKQLVALCAIRLADPIAFTQIFPYVNEMMTKLGVATDASQVGFYSGLVVSLALLVPFGIILTKFAGKCLRYLPAVIHISLGKIIRCARSIL